MSADADTPGNLRTGWLTLGAAALALAALATWFGYRQAQDPPPRFVLYTTNAGTVNPGDPVVLNGRRVGRVLAAELVQREGGLQVRIEAELLPQFAKLQLSPDTAVTVTAPDLLRGPRLVLRPGQEEGTLKDRAELTHVTPADSTDAVTTYGRALMEAREDIRAVAAEYGSPEFLGTIRDRLAEVRLRLEQAEAVSREARVTMGNAAAVLDPLPEQLQKARADVQQATAELDRRLQQADEQTARAPGALDDLAARLTDLHRGLQDLDAAVGKAAQATRDPAVRGSLLEARWGSARLAAMMDLSRRNPGRAGDDAGAQAARARFNGGRDPLEPFGGKTKLDHDD